MRMSVIVIAKNEEHNMERCLGSVAWADEIVVVDSDSTDRTVEIAKRYTSKVYNEAWRGFGAQKNLALSYATGDWVLSLDADEWVSESLRSELIDVARTPRHDAYRMPRSSSFCGRFMRHSGWSPDFVTRFFRRDAARFSDDRVHERLIVNGSVGSLESPLMHESYRNLAQVIDKMNRYSTLSAQDLHAAGRKASVSTAVARGLWAFFRTYILRAGFLDGREGLMVAVATAENTYYKYLKLVYLRVREKTDRFPP